VSEVDPASIDILAQRVRQDFETLCIRVGQQAVSLHRQLDGGDVEFIRQMTLRIGRMPASQYDGKLAAFTLACFAPSLQQGVVYEGVRAVVVEALKETRRIKAEKA
jgi:uncharacterized protein YjhX (UPF0386 family)